MQPTSVPCRGSIDDLQSGLPAVLQVEEALRRFTTEGDGSLLSAIRPIVLTNARRGRLERCLGRGRYASAEEYVAGVVRHYQAWQPVLDDLITRPQDEAWRALLDQLQRAARRYLRPAAPYLLDSLESSAAAAAVDAAIEVLRGRYPYDCDFPAWVCATTRVLCRRILTDQCRTADMRAYCWDTTGDPDDLAAEWGAPDDRLLDLELATDRLATPARREFARLHYYEGKSYDQLAGEMGKSLGALYKLNSDTLANYRQLLSR